MRAVVVVVVAVATLLGLGWYFADSHLAGKPAPQMALIPSGAGSAQGQLEAGLGPANMHPEKDGQQFVKSKNERAVEQAESNGHVANISFEGAELPNGSWPGRDRHALGSHKNGEWNDPKFANLNDDNEVVGRYVHRKMVVPRDPSLARNVPQNDDLLIMEEDSENRLSATR